MTLSLAFPWAFLLLPAPFIAWRFLPPYRTTSQAIRIPFFREVSEATGLTPREGSVVLIRRRLQVATAILCWLLVLTGLARPELLGQRVTVEKAARDLALAVDLSGSMDERDMKDSDGQPQQRLQVVKDVVADFVSQRDGDRIGLIVFGTKAYVQTPFTEDLETVAQMLDDTRVGMAGPDTAIGDAIGLAIHTFETSEVEQRLLVLLSDGADNASRMSPVNAAEIAAQEGVTIYTIGVGDPSGSGNDKVDLDALQDIARRANGDFYYGFDQEGLARIYNEIDRLNPRITETVTFQPRQPLGWIPFGAAVVLALCALFWLSFWPQRKAV
ncbi:VWA domain-containing protein [Ruegeria sediminis]|uniref:VWA domain-containing protein n=1 Tax=Ruegeria sediminis TaxID=2583820 RepID=A0ABY2X2D2_9RHOB|nr:VWA domain-containing protein [Ruegeria sediminis]TMV09048.1 VWA domain-containing protein [Ruegeria sediminis]